MYMEKDSTLTPFFANGVLKMAESGITNIHTKRHIISKPNCKPLQAKGRPLGMAKFASLFAFYSIACTISLIILVMENIFKPSPPQPFEYHSPLHFHHSQDDGILKTKIETIINEWNTFSDDNAMQIFLFTQIKSLLLKK